jgi:hypothetical protein
MKATGIKLRSCKERHAVVVDGILESRSLHWPFTATLKWLAREEEYLASPSMEELRTLALGNVKNAASEHFMKKLLNVQSWVVSARQLLIDLDDEGIAVASFSDTSVRVPADVATLLRDDARHCVTVLLPTCGDFILYGRSIRDSLPLLLCLPWIGQLQEISAVQYSGTLPAKLLQLDKLRVDYDAVASLGENLGGSMTAMQKLMQTLVDTAYGNTGDHFVMKLVERVKDIVKLHTKDGVELEQMLRQGPIDLKAAETLFGRCLAAGIPDFRRVANETITLLKEWDIAADTSSYFRACRAYASQVERIQSLRTQAGGGVTTESNIAAIVALWRGLRGSETRRSLCRSALHSIYPEASHMYVARILRELLEAGTKGGKTYEET